MRSLVRRPWIGGATLVLTAACASGDPERKPFACDVTLPTACPDPMPHYADVQPIFERRCATPCHSDTSTGPWPLTSYQDVADWYDVIRDTVGECSMPPRDSGQTLPSDESQAILTWIRCGFPR